MPSQESWTRRRFIASSAGAFGSGWVALNWPQILAAHEHARSVDPATATFAALSPAQASTVEAITAQIVPSGETPGAREARVVYFIDRALGSFFVSQAEAFHAGLEAFSAGVERLHGADLSFADLDEARQIEYLKRLEATPFFGTMRFLTVLGLFSLPEYGGNHEKLGWRLVGFVDQHSFAPPFGHYDRDYPGFVPRRSAEQS